MDSQLNSAPCTKFSHRHTHTHSDERNPSAPKEFDGD